MEALLELFDSMYTYIYNYMYICVYIYMHTHTIMSCIYKYICVCLHVYMYTFRYTRKQMYIFPQEPCSNNSWGKGHLRFPEGSMRRNRAIESAPRNGGLPCQAEDKEAGEFVRSFKMDSEKLEDGNGMIYAGLPSSGDSEMGESALPPFWLLL